MNMKKIVAMTALATVLSSGIGAHAAVVGFDQNASTNTQEAESFIDTTQKPNDMPDAAQGDIEITGTFRKTTTNFPDPEQDGRYLNVSMPIKLDFEYNANTGLLTSAQGTIINGSVKAENMAAANGKPAVVTPQPITMEFVGLAEDGLNGNSGLVEFVSTVDRNRNDTVQVPLQLETSRMGTSIKNYSLEAIEDDPTSFGRIKINADDKIQLQFGLIPGETVYNEDLFGQDVTTTKHNLTLKFEYDGK